MDSVLDALKSAYSAISNSINEWLTKRQGYLDHADEIKVVYNRLKDDKAKVKTYKSSVKAFYENEYATFKGSNFNTGYKPAALDIVDSYDVVITNIDTNMDALNDEITRYQNLAYECDGPIGSLRAELNSLWTQIENWAN